MLYYVEQENQIRNIPIEGYKQVIELDYKEIVDNSFASKLPFEGDVSLIDLQPTPWKKKELIHQYKKLKQDIAKHFTI